MKKIISMLLAVILAFSVVLVLGSCGGSNGERYDLVDIDFSGITVEHYEYNYIEFDHDEGTYSLKNKTKLYDTVTRQTGRFIVDPDNKVTITNDLVPTQNYLLYSGEKAYFSGNKFYVSASIPGYGNVSMTFEK